MTRRQSGSSSAGLKCRTKGILFHASDCRFASLVAQWTLRLHHLCFRRSTKLIEDDTAKKLKSTEKALKELRLENIHLRAVEKDVSLQLFARDKQYDELQNSAQSSVRVLEMELEALRKDYSRSNESLKARAKSAIARNHKESMKHLEKLVTTRNDLTQEVHRLQSALKSDRDADEEVKILQREANNLQSALTSMQEEINRMRDEKSELQIALQKRNSELAREQQEKVTTAMAKSELHTALNNTKREAERQAHFHRSEMDRIVQERADLWAELLLARETAKECQTQVDDWKGRFAAASTELTKQDGQNISLREELAAELRKRDENIKALHEGLAGKDMALSSLREAMSKSERITAAKDAEIKSLQVLEGSRQKELESSALERDRLREERDALNRQLQQREEHQEQMQTLLRQSEAQDAEMRQRNRDLEQRLQGSEAECQSLEQELNASRKEPKDMTKSNANLARCRELVRFTETKVAQDLLKPDRETTTLGLAFEDVHGVITIKNVMIGGPAFCSRRIDREDALLAIDGQSATSVEQVVEALVGSDLPVNLPLIY